MNTWMNCAISGWIQQMNNYVDVWMNGWINEWINGLLGELFNKWLHKQASKHFMI